jgi:hypothetical protein
LNPHFRIISSDNHNNSHNIHNMFSSGDTSVASISTTTSEASSPSRHRHHQYEGVNPASYGIVETPETNPATVEATPNRLGDERGGGGGFEMKGPRPREAAGLALAAQVAIKKRKLQQHSQMSFGGTPCVVPSPSSSSSASPWHNNTGGTTASKRRAAAGGGGVGLGASAGRLNKKTGSVPLSPAAQRLAGELLLQKHKKSKGGGGGVGGGDDDVGLRASYGGVGGI